MRHRHAVAWVVAFGVSLAFGCKGGSLEVEGDNAAPNGEPNNANANANNEVRPNNDVEVNPDVLGVPTVTLRRLSQDEFDNTLEVLLQDGSRSFSLRLPEDKIDPFDNNGRTQLVSQPLVEGLETAATEAATAAMQDTTRRDGIIGCSPTGPDDATCFRSFVETFGRRAFRRPLTESEVDGFTPLQAFGVEAGDFYVGAALVIQAMLQMPDFIYHLQRGVAVDGRENTYRLGSFEVASRLSFFLWGSTPDDELLNAAERGELKTTEEVRAQAERMLQDPRVRTRVKRFHAMWLGYHRFNNTTSLGQAMTAETEALIDRVIFDDQSSYLDLFTSDQSFVNDELAGHYGLSATPGATGSWVDVSSAGRGGILSHATFLGVAGKFGDTSPTQRGRLIRERILCTPVPPPDPTLGVDVDSPPTSADSTCKTDRYAAILQDVGCAACHNQMDPIGMGLENYSQTGQFRETDVDDPNCPISGDGVLYVGADQVPFNGPRELGQTLVAADQFESCVVKQVWQFAMGNVASGTDAATLELLQADFAAGGHRFDQLLLDVVSSESFLYRIEPEAQP